MSTSQSTGNTGQHSIFQSGIPPGLRRVLIASAVVHAVLAVVVLAPSFGSKRRGPPQEVITTKLVRLGEERPPELLPRKTQPSPPSVTPKKPVTAPEVSVPQKPEPKPKTALERAKQVSQLSSALNRLKENLDPPEGSKDGSKFGNSAVGESIVANKYYNEIGLCLENNYFIEGVGSERVAGMKAVVALWIDGTGKFISHKIEESSGSRAFDRATSAAVERCGKVSPPPASLRDELRKHGVAIEFKPD